MMAQYQKQFCVEAYTPETHVAGVDVVSVILPAVDGQIGILAGHAPMVAMIGAGVLRITQPGGAEMKFFVAGGFCHVRENAVTILAEECVPTEWLDAEEAWQELQSAKKMSAETSEEWRRRDQAVRAARSKFNLAQQRRRREIEAAKAGS